MKLRRLIIWPSCVFVLDQVTKLVVDFYIEYGTGIPVIPNFFDLVHVKNRGAAFGMFADLPDPYRFILLSVVSAVAVLFIAYYYWTLPKEHENLQVPLTLILGGAAGNIFDRLVRGEVIDFLSFHWYDKWVQWELGSWVWEFRLEWPSFNVADMAISLSVVWLLFKVSRHKKAETGDPS